MRTDTSILAFENYLITMGKSLHTVRSYIHGAQKFSRFCGENSLKIDATLPPGAMSLFAEWETHQGASPASVSLYVSGAKKYMAWLRMKGVGVPIPGLVDLPKIERTAPESLQEDILVAFFEATARNVPEPCRSALLLGPFCGLRGHELVNMRLDDFRSQVTYEGSSLRPTVNLPTFVVKGKGGKVRFVPLLQDGIPILNHYLTEWRSKQRPSQWLFPSPAWVREDRPISYRVLAKYMSTVTAVLRKKQPRGAQAITIHTLRRVYSTTMHQAGIDPLIIQAAMGHESFSTTQKHYIEVQQEQIAGAVAHVRLGFAGARQLNENKKGNIFDTLAKKDAK